MSEYEQYLAINVLVDAYTKYQGKCMDLLHTIELKISACNTTHKVNETLLNDLIQQKSDVKDELKKISDDLSALATSRMSLLTTLQGEVMSGANIDFEDLKY